MFEIKIDTSISLEAKTELVDEIERHMGYDFIHIWNANINGYIIQLRTNNTHLEDFFRECWYPASLQDHIRPHGTIFAVTEMRETDKQIAYHSETKTGIIVNINSYEMLRSLALGMVWDISETRKSLHFMRCSLVDINGDGFALTGDNYDIVSSHMMSLLELEQARVHSHELVFVEHLGGLKGRMSTHVSERKFYLSQKVMDLSSATKSLIGKCKRENGNYILDPWWIGGNEKYIDTTRIKAMFVFNTKTKQKDIIRRLSRSEALNLFLDAENPFFNPHHLINTKEHIDLLSDFYNEIFEYVQVYEINPSFSTVEKQKAIRTIVSTKDYTQAYVPTAKAPKFDFDEVMKNVDLNKIKSAVKNAMDQSNISKPTPAEVRKDAEKYGTKTKFGNYNFVSTVKNRSAPLTVYIGSNRVRQTNLTPKQREIIKNAPKTIKNVLAYLKKGSFVYAQRTIGQNDEFTPTVNLFVSDHRNEMVRLVHMMNQTFFETKEAKDPQLYMIYIPEWQEKDRQMLAFPEIGVTFVLGSDYYGEIKKGFLRMCMWFAKERGYLGLHAGAKIIRAKDKTTNKIKRYGTIIFGLTATGKTTHSCHNHDLNLPGEGIEIVQDDFVAMKKDGSAYGTERGFFLKTEGMDEKTQPLIYRAITTPDAIFENVMVDYQGNVDFGDETLTGNGRGIMQWADFKEAKAETPNLPSLDEIDGLLIILITRRNTVVPIASKLNIEQMAAMFMLGESTESSGGDPRRAGESVRVVGTNPFVVGDEASEGNIFYDLIKENPEKIKCFMVNTGGLGEIMEKNEDGTKHYIRKVSRIEIPEMASIIRGIARDEIEWEDDKYFGTQIPKNVPGMNISKYDVHKFYPQKDIDRMVAELKAERKEYLDKYPNLNKKIKSAFKF